MSDKNTGELRACPFCEANKGFEMVRRKDAKHEDCAYSMVACPMCCCEGPLGLDDDDAVAQWNRRPNAPGEGRGIPRTLDPIVGNLDSEVTQ